MNDKRLIEETIPLEDISRESAREKSIRHGHISTLHIWWARRPLVASRAAVFGSLVIPSKISKDSLNETAKITKKWLPELKKVTVKDEELQGKELYHFMRVLCIWEASNNEEIINHARKLIKESHDGKIPKVLDPFAGGGSIPLEALRLGCETYANELNPVAYIIELCTLVYPQKYGKWVEVEAEDENKAHGQLGMDTGKKTKKVNKLAEDVRKWGNWVLKEAKKEIGEFYPRQEGKDLVAYIWAKLVKCPNPSCGNNAPLIGQFWLVNKPNRKVFIKPQIKSSKLIYKILEGEKSDFDPSLGTAKGGNARCLFCNQSIGHEYILEETRQGRLTYSPIAKVVSGVRHKEYFEVTDLDRKMIRKSQRYYAKLNSKKSFFFPDEPLPEEGSLGITKYFANTHGSKRSWAEIHTPRQLVTFSVLNSKIKESFQKARIDGEEDYVKAIITYLGILLDRVIARSTTICRWHNRGEKIEIDIGAGKLPNVWDFAESNPLGNSTGSWVNDIDWVTRVIDDLSRPDTQEANVNLGTATKLELRKEMVDAIVTDPPYYDAVPYAELSDFFYVWLKRSIGFLYPEVFRTPLTPKSQEIVQNPIRHGRSKDKAKKFFERELTNSFKESNRVLGKNGVMGIMFAHKSTSAWETLVKSLLDASLVVSASWPLHTEMGSRLRAHGSAALASSILLVCRKKVETSEGYYDEVKLSLKDRVKERLDDFWNSGIRGADFFISAIGPAVEVFGKYSKVKKLSGEEVSVSEFLSLVREEVTNYALEKILSEGNVTGIDPETRFYILWRWAYDGVKVPFDDARILAQAIGVEIDDLMSKTGVLKKSGDNVELLGPQEIKVSKVGSLIDALHRSCQLWEEGKKQELAEFLEENGKIRDELFWSTAQALSEVLPDGDKEKQLLQGLLASRSGIVGAVKQERLF